MPNQYTFLNLSPFEFELLTRDLLQEYLGVHLESFASGADQGIDLRSSRNGQMIIQCKRYNDFTSLFANLQKEVDKVQRLNPNRYILSTSLEMTPDRKNKILNLFAPYIKTVEDIIGCEDLNNFLGLYPKIEKQHFKLWLSSTNILNEIVNRNIVNQSKFVLDDIYNKIKIYVQNNSYSEGLELLEKHRYIIISGIPGIGKTTLAEVLVYNLLAHGVEEFVYISDSIEQGYKLYDSGKSQVFLFDDFLGRNFLENSLKTNEESLIIKFIERIKESKNKFLIFTTREYILKQACLRYDLFDVREFIKCIVDLSKYTKLAKAKILYNHLYFNDTPAEYVNELISQGLLYKIIEHPNYNPRIVETFTKSLLWKKIDIKGYPLQILALFDKPELIWKHAFEHAISARSRFIMFVFLMQGDSHSLEYETLYELMISFCQRYGQKYSVNYTLLTFKNSIKELEDTFISIHKDSSNKRFVVYQNPSIQDFLINYLNEDDSLKSDLINKVIYFDQLLRLYSDVSESEEVHNLTITPLAYAALSGMLISGFNTLKLLNQPIYFAQKVDLDIYKLYLILKFLNLSDKSELREFVIDRVSNIMYSDEIESTSYYLVDIAVKLREHIRVDVIKLLGHIVTIIDESDDLLALNNLRQIDNAAFSKFEVDNQHEFLDMIEKVSGGIVDNTSDEDIEDSIWLLRQIESGFGWSMSDEIYNLEQRLDEYKQELEIQDYDRDWDYRKQGAGVSVNKYIDDLFGSYM